MFRGSIPKGSLVQAQLQLDASAGGTALIAMSFADNAGGSGADSATVAPGGSTSCTVQTNPQPTGLLRIFADVNNSTDVAQLNVLVNGQPFDGAPITGDASWSYSLS